MLQKNATPKSNHGKGKPAPSGAFTHRIREDGEIFSGEEGRETSSDTTPLASVAGSVRMRSTDSDRSVRATPKKARDASPPPQDDLWVVVKNLSQQVAAQQAELDALRNAIVLQQKATANLEKILGNMASQMTSTSEATQTALAAILARLEVGPVVPQVVVVGNDYPPLKKTGATPKSKTMATKPNSNIATTTTTTTTTDQTSKDTCFADAVKKRPTHQQLVERQPDFRKAGAAAWLALERETLVPAHSAPKVELSSGLRLIYASGFPYAKPGDLRKAMRGARIRTSAVRDIRWISRQVVQLLVDADYVSAFTRIITSLDATIVKSFKAWVPRSEAADKDKLAAILSFAAKTVTTIQRSPDVKARNFFRSLLASIGGKTLEAATAEAAKIRVQTPGFDISTLEIIPKESLPIKKATDKEPAAPAVDSPSDMAAEITPAIQVDGAAPTVTPIAEIEITITIYHILDIRPCSRLNHIPPLHSRSNPGSPDGTCLQDRSPYHKTRCSIPHNGPLKTDNEISSSASSAKASKPTGVFGKTTDIAVQTSLDQQPHLHHYHGRSSQSMLPISATNVLLFATLSGTPGSGPSQRPVSLHLNFALLSLDSMSSSIQPRDLDAEESPSVSHRALVAMNMDSAVGTMILAKVPNFTPECLWIVGSVYVGHSGATTNYSRREAFASIRQSLDRVVPFDNNHPVLIFGDWNTDPQRLQRIVHSWGHGLTVMQFSGSQITRLSTVHGRRHSSIDHFVCNAPARALLTSPRVDRQTAVADHFVIRTSIRAEAQGQPPVPRAPTISRHHCLEATDRIATSNYWDVLADVATDNTDTDTDIHQLTSQFLESANAVADNLSLRLSPPATRSNRRLLSGATKRAILASNTARQAFIAAATHTNPDPVQCNTLRDEWYRLKAAVTQLERADGRKQWVKHADNLDRAVSDGRTDLVFAAARAMSGNSSRSAAVTPLYNSDGIVQYDPISILRVMQGHYGSLAADTTGHSLDLQYWHDRQPIQVPLNTPPIRNSDILDQDFSWNQIAAALLQMSPRKAPGDDGITTAFYQAALYMPANTQEDVPPTPFARALLRVCGQVFASATIPRAWLCASIVSIDKKDGDPLNPGDKRGIALINVGLKLVCKVLQMRIERFVEANNLLSYEQAGFRKREECVGQVVSLVDIIQRRQNAGLNTHVLFIDIRKAFDTVPVDALLWKLQNMGFPRRTLAFLKALYTSSSARARAGHFPGLSRDTNPIRGLMYADDVAVFADSEQSLLAASTAVEQWANQWEMQFGVAKCGIISFTGHLAPRLDTPLDIRLHGQLVSRVESYKYLGVLIDSKLDHSAWLKQKRSALEHTISALHPVLANHQLTVNYRSRIFSAVVMGKAYYGHELVGGNKSHLAPLQTTINKGIRLFTGARLSTAIGPLLVETGIGSLLTRSLVSRVRLLERSMTKRTPINAICSSTDNDVFTLNVQGRLLLSTSIAHLVVECEQVTGHRIQSGLAPAIQKSRLRLLGRAFDPGIENVYTWLRGGVLNGEADLDQRWLDGTVEHESMGTRHDNRALAARLADFLQVAYRQYQSTLWKYHRDRLVEVD
ncbi:hypothetical protein BASA81_009446 [Batrachochytrium salamandrivorans]|nr:hypothetical protein BASA81_009446 [Batrachochytrium salamandrivorans]